MSGPRNMRPMGPPGGPPIGPPVGPPMGPPGGPPGFMGSNDGVLCDQ